ncbi:hypothetical protein ACOMHN_052329 [Nucella lapillus]
MAGSALSLIFQLVVVVVMLLVLSVSAQLASSGVCYMVSGATCEDTHKGCPPGKTPLKNVPLFTPWLCGGWLKICCVKDSGGETTPITPTTSPIDSKNCGLGKPTRRIVNGTNTSKCQWPFVVSIRGRVQPHMPLTQATTQHACAGVIIDKHWILTHAVCLYTTNKEVEAVPQELVVVAGEYNIDKDDQDNRYTTPHPLEQFIPVRQAFTHPGFASIQYLSDLNLADNQNVNGNALALIKLAEPVNDFCASTACLPSASPMTSSSCDTFEQCVILGWGFNTRNYQNTDGTMKQGFVKVYKDYVCDFLQSSVFSSGPKRFNGSACMSANFGEEVCLGDQGGPVLCYNGERWAVQGILPFSLCNDNVVNPYVLDVDPFQDWIYRTIRNNS